MIVSMAEKYASKGWDKISDAIKKRQTVRKFTKDRIPERLVEKLKRYINMAPSAGNLQAYHVYVTTDEEKKKKLMSAAFNQRWTGESALIMAFCTDSKASEKYGERGETLYSVQDATIAAAYSQLIATELGFASVWVGAFDERKAKEALQTELRPIILMCFGYPDEVPQMRPRKGLEELFEEI